MKNKRIYFFSFTALLLALLLCACEKKAEQIQPTEEIFMPTRSVATVPVPTKPASCANSMTYLGDTNYEDGSVIPAGTKFTKEWEVINWSECSWDEKYHLFFISGNQMGAPDFVEIPHVPIGSRGKISVELTAPEEPGEYRSEWKLFGADNRFFGESLIVNIVVE
ncbi:MAG: hypothetical protein IKP86_07085 [Anaerolineaceae bacterium]|nr:hypothetical protein [Anaerolineaceae bacterium]